MATIEAHHNVCVIVVQLSQDAPVCSVMVMAVISVISALEFLCVEYRMLLLLLFD